LKIGVSGLPITTLGVRVGDKSYLGQLSRKWFSPKLKLLNLIKKIDMITNLENQPYL
jgi:hypothetical protein